MMKRVFYSFHYSNDCWRVSQIKNMGLIEGQKIVTSNEWEGVKRGGDTAIKKWINENMQGRSTVIVLIGSDTSNRKWVKYEIEQAWNNGKKLVGIYIHNLKDQSGNKSSKGTNPFRAFSVADQSMSDIVPCFDPSTYDTYNDIKDNLERWVDSAKGRDEI